MRTFGHTDQEKPRRDGNSYFDFRSYQLIVLPSDPEFALEMGKYPGRVRAGLISNPRRSLDHEHFLAAQLFVFAQPEVESLRQFAPRVTLPLRALVRGHPLGTLRVGLAPALDDIPGKFLLL